MTDIDQLATLTAGVIYSGFNAFHEEFRAITRRAGSRFERRDWHGMQADSVERLNLYKKIVDRVVAALEDFTGKIPQRDDITLCAVRIK